MPESSGSVWGSTLYKRAAVCPRADRLYSLGVRKAGPKSKELDFGDAFHLTLEAYYRARQQGKTWRDAVHLAWSVTEPLRDIPEYGEFYDELTRVCTSYFELAANDRWDVVAVEEELTYQSPEIAYSARLDLVAVIDGELWSVEHKSTKVITKDAMSGYLLDLQTLGQIWLLRECVDLTQYPPLAGVLVNMTSKQKTPQHERVPVRATEAHLREFERHLKARQKMRAYAADLGYPKMLGNCSGAAQYFKSCGYFDICHGQPEFDVVGVDKLTTEDLPFGFRIEDAP
jgi:hypothetical protein